MKDVLDLFGDLPDYPGKRKPKNRPLEKGEKRDSVIDPFHGVPKKTMSIKGVLCDFYTVGNVARILGRTAQTVRKWERKGWIPSPTYRTVKASGSEEVNASSKGYRLYSREQVELLWNTMERLGLLGTRDRGWQDADKWLSFIEQVRDNWPK